MTVDLGLRIAAIGLPVIAALVVWRRSMRRWLVVSIFGVAGLAGLVLFVVNRHYACIVRGGQQNCLFDGLATLSLFALNAVLARRRVVIEDTDPRGDDILMLLLSGAWAGMGLAGNLEVFVVFLNLFLFVIHRLIQRKGLKWRFLVIRDDFEDDQKGRGE